MRSPGALTKAKAEIARLSILVQRDIDDKTNRLESIRQLNERVIGERAKYDDANSQRIDALREAVRLEALLASAQYQVLAAGTTAKKLAMAVRMRDVTAKAAENAQRELDEALVDVEELS